MNKERYEELMLRFALELHEIGVNDYVKGLVEDSITRSPNTVSATGEDITRRFTYRYNGYMIQAEQTVKLTVKKCR
jgi:hypothetical protein